MRDNLARVRENIARIQAREGVNHPVTIVGVTKGHPPDVIRAAAQSGLEDIGENRVQEALRKLDEVGRSELRWHLIGHLQTNKAKFVPGTFDVVHSVDSEKVGTALRGAWERWAEDESQAEPLDVLVQVNVSGEAQKTGCDPAAALDIARGLVGERAFRLRGVMTMAPFTSDEKVQRRVFAGLRALREKLEEAGLTVPELSMGMSADYESAVAEGATMIRLGTILFGERNT